MFKKILNTEQIRKADSFTIKNEPIASIDLMERAAQAFVNGIYEDLQLDTLNILICCGVGNNGGDGLAVSRILRSQGISNTALLVKFKDSLSPDCESNFKRLNEVLVLKDTNELPDFKSYDLIIDALFGTGIKSPLHGLAADAVKAINDSGAIIYSIDLPSGLYSDKLNEATTIIQADKVISFQRPKLSFFFPENDKYIGHWRAVDIGLDEAHIQSQDSSYFVLDKNVQTLLKKRRRYSHKGTYGHALLMAGSKGKIGAAVLASKASLRSGVGLLSIQVPKCGYEVIQSSVPEAMCLTDDNSNYLSKLPKLDTYSAIGIGPGLGKEKDTLKLLQNLLQNTSVPIVLDADALNLIALNKKLLDQLPKDSILTPHIKEFDRLVGRSKNSLERYKKQVQFSKNYHCIIVLKDAHTSISTPKGLLHFNTSGNPGMATGGSGDVLTGIITGLLAQGYSSLDSALLAVYYHGLAGDSAAMEYGQSAMLASDIIEALYFND